MDGGQRISQNDALGPVAKRSANIAGIQMPRQVRSAPQSQAAIGGSSEAATTTITGRHTSNTSGFNFSEMLQKLKALRGSSGSSTTQTGGESESQSQTAASGNQSASDVQVAENLPPPPPDGPGGTIAGSAIGDP